MEEQKVYGSYEMAHNFVQCCLSKHIPFYVSRYPYESMCRMGAQVASSPVQGMEDGFRIVPFSSGIKTFPFTIQPDTFPCDIDRLQALEVRSCEEYELSDTDIDYETYKLQASALIERMQTGELQKAVLSRTITRSCDVMSILPNFYTRLCEQYPTAYVFMVYNPGVCGWIGATPEVLLESTADGYLTMALAGTRSAGIEDEWGAKEQDEQQYVVRYIADILRRHKYTDVSVATTTRQAAQVEHLCTVFDITARHDKEQRDKLVEALHPTPAVAGTPLSLAIRAINSVEIHSRRYYGGYIGESMTDGCCRFYVNLRSMEFSDNKIRLYVGGGLTAQSVPYDEWEETCAKSQTLLRVLENVM